MLLPRETRQRQQHHEHFKSFDTDGNRPLAETIRQETARHGKHNERQREQRADQLADLVLFGERHVHADDHEDDEIFQDVVAERALELRDDERPEAALPSFRRDGGVWFHKGRRVARAAVSLQSTRCVGT